ncbi:uncharacterized protein LOC122899344 isoform X2 [Neovison vison]|uniref:uncharacterized protein LOC122899344 isoform X2 n=1 Tax=Neovison vison TaxID=452646 RepID=UPI001CF09BB2|nr:uncharacterized protein LOC122899344 isoform X2 [Neogale vison]
MSASAKPLAPAEPAPGPEDKPRGKPLLAWGSLLGHRSEKIVFTRSEGAPEENVLSITITETTVIESELGVWSSRALLYLTLWFFFSFCTLFLNKYILSLLEGEPSMLAQNPAFLPTQFHHDHAVCGSHEVRDSGFGSGQPEKCGSFICGNSEELCSHFHCDHVPDDPWGVHGLAGQPLPHPHHGGPGTVHGHGDKLQRPGVFSRVVHQHHGLFAECFFKKAPQWGQIQVLGRRAPVLQQRRGRGHAGPRLGLLHGSSAQNNPGARVAQLCSELLPPSPSRWHPPCPFCLCRSDDPRSLMCLTSSSSGLSRRSPFVRPSPHRWMPSRCLIAALADSPAANLGVHVTIPDPAPGSSGGRPDVGLPFSQELSVEPSEDFPAVATPFYFPAGSAQGLQLPLPRCACPFHVLLSMVTMLAHVTRSPLPCAPVLWVCVSRTDLPLIGRSGRSFSYSRDVVLLLLTDGALFHLQSVTAYALMGQISPVTFSVASTVKHASTTWLSVIVFGNSVTSLSATGTALVTAGVLLYNKARQHQQEAMRSLAAAASRTPEDDTEPLTPKDPRPHH